MIIDKEQLHQTRRSCNYISRKIAKQFPTISDKPRQTLNWPRSLGHKMCTPLASDTWGYAKHAPQEIENMI